jgi:hypothetical protein
MKKNRYSEEQIIGLLKQHEVGVKTQICAESMGSLRRRFMAGSRSLAGWT